MADPRRPSVRAAGGAPDDAIPTWAHAALRAPVADPPRAAAARARVMAAVRALPAHDTAATPGDATRAASVPAHSARPAHPARADRLTRLARLLRPPVDAPPRWARRGLLAPDGLAALAAALLVSVLGARAPHTAPGGTVAVLGDTVTALHDTLRLVRFVLAGPEAARARTVAVAAAFNDWDPTATPLVRDRRTGAWSVTVAVPRDALRAPGRGGRVGPRHAFVLDGARWVRGARGDGADRRDPGGRS